MKSVPTVLQDAIRSDYALYAQPRLIVDWNMNRYGNPTTDNTPAEEEAGFDVEIFPIESIIEPIRPTKGICKARIGEGTIGDAYSLEGTTDMRTAPARFYLANVDDVYKYWTAPVLSDALGNITECEPFVLYGTDVSVNKIVVKLENSWATPDDFTIQITTDGTTWSTIATSPTVRNDGQVILYYNGTGWSSNRPVDITNLATIKGIKISVTSLKGGYDGAGNPTTYKTKDIDSIDYTVHTTDGTLSNFNLISLEAHREVDLTDRLIGIEDTFDTSEVSMLYPIGTLTSNGATVSLSNVDGIFNGDNIDSPYYNLLEPNVEMNLEYVYTIDDVEYSVQQFKLYTDGPWAGERTDTVSVELSDASKHLEEITPNPAMWEGLTVPQIVWRLLDSVGFVDYQIDSDDRTTAHTIPVFWVDGSKSAWEVLDDLAKGTQTAIYFDSSGLLQVKTREAAFNDAQTPSWTLRGETAGTELADIVEWGQTEEFDANHIKVNYTDTKWSDWNNGQPTMQKVWEPDTDVVTLRSSQIKYTLEVDSEFLRIPAADVVYWPWNAKVNIEGELIEYDGKQFVYYTGALGDTRNVAVLRSQDEYKSYIEKTPVDYQHKNHFTGGLAIKERGVWNSEVKVHSVDASGYSVRHIANGVHRGGVDGFKHNSGYSTVTLYSGSRLKRNEDLLVATRGAADDTGFYVYGTMIRFEKEKGRTTQRAGLVIHNEIEGNNEDGYYIEFTPSKKLGGKERKNRHELILYSRVNGKDHRIGGRGTALAIAEEVWYEVDVYYNASGGDHNITVYVNGRNVMTESISGTNKNDWNGKFGMFLRGKTKASFEYLYGISRAEVQPADDVSFFDMVQGGYRGGQWDREWVYSWKTRRRRVKKRWKTERYRYNNMFMDEFGPIVHEIREFDVKFDPKPVLHSRLYMTNDWNAICTEYGANPFGAKFIIANSGRENCVIHGEDTIRYSSTSRTVNQALTVLGRPLVISDAESVIAKNDQAIQRRGKVEAELSSDWIQSKTMAEDIAEWIKNHWGTGVDSAQVTIFGNPLIEIGDVVSVDYPHKDMSPETHKYFVTGTATTFENGLNTVITMRRVV